MADDKTDRPQTKSENPDGAGFPENPDQMNASYGRNAHPDRAERAGERATSDEPVSVEEIRDQSGYEGMEIDVAQRAAESEKAEAQGDDADAATPRAFPDAKP